MVFRTVFQGKKSKRSHFCTHPAFVKSSLFTGSINYLIFGFLMPEEEIFLRHVTAQRQSRRTMNVLCGSSGINTALACVWDKTLKIGSDRHRSTYSFSLPSLMENTVKMLIATLAF